MEKHQLSTIISGLSLLAAIVSIIVPTAVYAGDGDHEDDDDDDEDIEEYNINADKQHD
jgi:hypothetical protein